MVQPPIDKVFKHEIVGLRQNGDVMEYTKKVLEIILKCICVVVCIILVIIGQKNISYQGLFTMLAGLGGILLLLYLYNRKYK